MNISAPFIRRPVATTLLTVGLALAGLAGLWQLPVAPLPQVEFPTISVSAGLPGASPETMATSVAAPLERQFGRIAGVTEMTSSSSLGSTSIILQFDLERDIDGAARDVQAAINAARGELPANLPSNPSYRKVKPADAPILILSLTSERLTPGELYDVAATTLQQGLSQVQGVGQVNIGGSSLPAVRIDANPTALTRYGLGLEDIRTTVQANTLRRPKGAMHDGEQSWQVETNDQLVGAAAYRDLIIHHVDGAALRLRDVAEVTDATEDVRTGGVVNGRRAILLAVFRSPGANVIETVARIHAALPHLHAALPATVRMHVVMDRTPPIRASLHHVELALGVAVVLVILVVFVFLRDVRAALIPSVAVPVSLIATGGVMYLCGYSLDNLSLMALAIAAGFVVDDAIVVLENISRHIEAGESPREAALRGSQGIGFTVLAMSVSLVAVFIPLLLMGGMLGRLFREFAVTLSAAVAISLVISLTTTPMMCAVLLRPRRHGAEPQPGWLARAYAVTLDLALRHPRSVLALTVGTVVLNVVLFAAIPKGFFPTQDTGRLTGAIQGAQNTSFQAMWEKLIAVADLVGRDPAVAGVMAFTGGGGGPGGGGGRNSARMWVTLKPADERDSADAVMARLRPQLAKIPGAQTFLQPVQDLRIGGRGSSALYQYTLQGDDVSDLSAAAPRVLQALRGLPQLVDVNTDQLDGGLESRLVIDRVSAARLRVSPQRLDDALYDAFGQRQIATVYGDQNQYRVVLGVAPRFLERPATLQTLYVTADSGAQVPLSAFTHYEEGATTLQINHQGQFPAVTLSFNLTPGVALSDAVEAIERATAALDLPAGVRGSFAGAAQAFQSSIDDQPLLILAALATVYIVLGIFYESYAHPLTILSTLPSAGSGAFAALLLTGGQLDIMSLIGVLLLIGIVKKNAIMMIDFALDAEREQGMAPADAIRAACLLRLRPILMTTLAALFGALPLAVGGGAGAELRRPLGIAIVGGLIVSQVLTLYTTPIVYLYVARVSRWLRELRGVLTRRLVSVPR
ncbi:MAG: efflux RND transporter permease subunit [Deltaproteobacteria bacterium]|nr:efflux RND transporter permease subunit [Deltaproteobacteria bacterium]